MGMGGRMGSLEELEAIRVGKVPDKTLVSSQRAMTGEQLAAWRHVVACARQFVRCADEFPDAPAASAEHYEALEEAQAREARAWEGSEPPLPDVLYPELRCSPFVAAPAPAWVPWPTSPGFWWHRTSPNDPAPEPVRAGDAGDGTVHAIYAIGAEEPCFRDGPSSERTGWAFCPVEPPR